MSSLRIAAAALLAAATGAAFVAAGQGDHVARPTRDLGALPTPVPVVASAPSKPVGPTTTGAATGATTGSTAGPPVQLVVPRLSVRAMIAPVTLSRAGALAVPDDPHLVGWWQASAEAGSTIGTVVLDGHVDSARAGLGALFHLAALRLDDRLQLTTRQGKAVEYRVVARRVVHKSRGLPATLFDPAAPGVLAVITCGGPFADGNYRDNVVVLARLVPPG